ncbi:MAG: copper resistance CopC family protein [Actinomycetota bacterium]
MRKFVFVAALMLGMGLAAPALAHGDLAAQDPEPDSSVKSVPVAVSATFTEAPAKQSVFKVSDGCGKDVVAHLQLQGQDAIAHIGGAQPGQWQVSYRVVSAVDGHLTEGKYAFNVKGKKDCSPDKPAEQESSNGDGENPEAQGPSGSAPTGSSDDGGLPVVPIAVGTVVLLGVAAAVRVLANR